MIPKIKEFENTSLGLLEALTYYKVMASKLSDLSKIQKGFWYEVNLSQGSFKEKHIITVNTGKSDV
mgnify:CR=1 FL=1